MDLTVVYSKTAKGMRARSSLIGGLSSQLMKVLSHIDGASKAETILDKLEEITELKLAAALTQLETEGYIKAILVAATNVNDWALTTNFAPMVVEDFQGTVSAEITEDGPEAQANADNQAKLQTEYKAKLKEEARLQAEIKAQLEAQLKAEEVAASQKAELEAQEAAEQARVKAQAEAKENARREVERLAQEAEQARKLSELEAQEKAEKEAKLASERKAKDEQEARLQTELEAQAAAEQEAAEQARVKAQAEVKENARREVERLTQEAEQARKKLEAEEKAKVEVARLAAEEKAKAEAQLEAERQAKAEAAAEAEAKIKADEKERARLDIARIVREAEEARKKSEAEAKEARLSAKLIEKADEEQKKAEAEAIARAELEAKLEAEYRAKAEEEARLQAEIKAKQQAEQNRTHAEAKQKASEDANLKASLAMQSFVTDATDAQKNADIAPNVEEAQLVTKSQIITAASQKADIKAKLKAEQIRAKYEAGEKAQAEEREIARLEMERIGREAEIERQKQHPQASAVLPLAALEAEAIEVQWGNPEQENDDNALEEERIAGEVEKVGLEIKKKTKRVAEVEGRHEIIRAAQEEAHVKAKSKVESQPLALTKHLGKWASAVRKVLLIYLPPAILLVLLLLHFINISPLVAPIEKLASESLGTPVGIEQIRASLWPRPHLVLKNITIGVDSAQKIEAINIAPVRLGLSEGVKTIKSIDIEGLEIEQENFGLALKWLASLSKAQLFTVEQITLHKIVLKIKDLELLPLDGEVMLTESRELKTIDLITDDETLAMQLTPQGSGFDIALNGTNWALPMNQKLVFNELKATGNIKQNSILFNQIEGAIYGGSFTGKAALDWSNQWSLAGNFNLSNANLPEILKAFASSASADGKFKLAGIFSSQSKLAATLTNTPEITANFTAQNGKINGVALDRAVLSKGSQSLAGDSTRFDKLTGSVKIKNGSYHYKQLVLKSDQFYAEGYVDIEPNQNISGRVSADLAAQSRRLQDSFNLAGNVSNVKRQ